MRGVIAVEECQNQVAGVQVQLDREKDQLVMYAFILHWFRVVYTVTVEARILAGLTVT